MIESLEQSEEKRLAPLSLVDAAAGYARASRAENTLRAYESDLATFRAWCAGQGMAALPALPATVVLYVTHLAQLGRSAATISRALVSISQSHKAAGLESPTSDEAVRTVLQGVRKTIGTAQDKKAPMRSEILRESLSGASLRDRAILLFGFAGGFRRSELAALQVEDLQRVAAGYVITVRRSKTDQEGRGMRKLIAEGRDAGLCPVLAVEAWLAGRASGSLFGCCDKTIARVLKRAAERAGLDPARYSGHSLRRGLITEAHLAGVNDADTMRHVGIRSEQVFRGYIDDADLVARAVRVL